MPVLCWYTVIQPPFSLPLELGGKVAHESFVSCGDSYVQRTSYSFFIMPLFLIVLGASSVGAAIALYIIRKYDPHA